VNDTAPANRHFNTWIDVVEDDAPRTGKRWKRSRIAYRHVVDRRGVGNVDERFRPDDCDLCDASRAVPTVTNVQEPFDGFAGIDRIRWFALKVAGREIRLGARGDGQALERHRQHSVRGEERVDGNGPILGQSAQQAQSQPSSRMRARSEFSEEKRRLLTRRSIDAFESRLGRDVAA
jgi:hypothetical protein